MIEPCPKGVCERLAGAKHMSRLRNDYKELLDKLVAINKFVASDSNAATYQSMAQYRNEIIKIINGQSDQGE